MTGQDILQAGNAPAASTGLQWEQQRRREITKGSSRAAPEERLATFLG